MADVPAPEPRIGTHASVRESEHISENAVGHERIVLTESEGKRKVGTKRERFQ